MSDREPSLPPKEAALRRRLVFTMDTQIDLAIDVVEQAQNLRGYMEEWKTRDPDEAAAIVDFIDAVDTYNLRND